MKKISVSKIIIAFMTLGAILASTFAFSFIDYNWSSNKFLSGINNERQKENLSTLKLNDDLIKLAQMRLDDMVSYNYFDHASPSGNDIDSILTKENYKYELRGENLAYGEFENEDDVMSGWMASKWHKYNILYKDFDNIGIAYKIVDNYMGGKYILVVTIFTKENTKKEISKAQNNTAANTELKNTAKSDAKKEKDFTLKQEAPISISNNTNQNKTEVKDSSGVEIKTKTNILSEIYDTIISKLKILNVFA